MRGCQLLVAGEKRSGHYWGGRMVERGRKITRLAGKVLFASLFVAGGVAHFATPETYMKIMPPYLPLHRELVLLSGFFEVALGILLLVSRTSRLAAWGLIALLVAVFPANVYMCQEAGRFGVPEWLLLLRLPLQGLLILWAYAYAGGASGDSFQGLGKNWERIHGENI